MMIIGEMFFFLLILTFVTATDITKKALGSTHHLPAAFGDFNSDKLIDIIVIDNNGQSVNVLLADREETPLKKSDLTCGFKNVRIRSVVPGDFDGDGAMDLAVIAHRDGVAGHNSEVFLLWGELNRILCVSDEEPLLKIIGQPVAMDFNSDMITDLFGVDIQGVRKWWVFANNRKPPPRVITASNMTGLPALRIPHSHAFADLNHDFLADLFLTTVNGFEIWSLIDGEWTNRVNVPLPATDFKHIGQSLLFDIDSDGYIDHMLPMCFDDNCRNSTLYVWRENKWVIIDMGLQRSDKDLWGFVVPDGRKYTDTITLRYGDVNMDGYFDILVTLISKDKSSLPQVTLLINEQCNGCKFSRKFTPKWDLFKNWNVTVMGAFFDFFNDGTLEVLLVHEIKKGDFEMVVYKNSLEYDATFLKVVVLEGICYRNCSHTPVSYGTNMPGPTVVYEMVTGEGTSQVGAAPQLSQSAHFSLHLPYVYFGLGRTPNFVDTLKIYIPSDRENPLMKEFTQIIPNSQMAVIPFPRTRSSSWIGKLFVIPSNNIIFTAAALVGICGFLVVIISLLHWREKRIDHKEKLQDAHKFHFDAM